MIHTKRKVIHVRVRIPGSEIYFERTAKTGLVIDYNTSAEKAQSDLRRVKRSVTTDALCDPIFDQIVWSGGRSGLIQPARIDLFSSSDTYCSGVGRELLLSERCEAAAPADLISFTEERIRRQLISDGIWLVVALLPDGHDVCLLLSNSLVGLRLFKPTNGLEGRTWNPHAVIASAAMRQ